ncbi:MAG: hypothetical protein LBN23_03590 [Paludibacter sp.]|jgi:urate oxidase|nr:hypothetical protein [Paludibacter sp.]
MATAVANINWLFPDNNVVVTTQDFQNMVYEAEHSGDMTFEQFRKSIAKWLNNNK